MPARKKPSFQSPAIQTAWQLDLSAGCSIAASALTGSHAHRGASDSGLRLILLLQGELDLGFGRQSYQLARRDSRGAEVLLVNLTEEEEFERRAVAPGLEKKVCMHIPAHWLQAHGWQDGGDDAVLTRFMQQHLATAQWQADPALAALAERFLQPQTESPLIARLRRESLAFELLASVLGYLQGQQSDAPAHITPRLQQVRDLLDSGAADDWTLTEIAAQACMSPATLQRHFRRQFGTSVFDYLRQQRLVQAREKLRRGQLTITSVALEAGYNSPANFATAFRRAFGVSPSECR